MRLLAIAGVSVMVVGALWVCVLWARWQNEKAKYETMVKKDAALRG